MLQRHPAGCWAELPTQQCATSGHWAFGRGAIQRFGAIERRCQFFVVLDVLSAASGGRRTLGLEPRQRHTPGQLTGSPLSRLSSRERDHLSDEAGILVRIAGHRVTGSSREIGCEVLAGAGIKVAMHYCSGKAEGEGVHDAIVAAGGEASLLQGGVARTGVVERLIAETVQHFGRIDVLINNAGDLIERRPVADTSDALFEQHPR